MNLFKPKLSPKEAAKAAQKETKQTVRTNQRQLDRDITALDRQEKLLLQQIKARAKAPGGVLTQQKMLDYVHKRKN
jgi:hypothetical protein